MAEKKIGMVYSGKTGYAFAQRLVECGTHPVLYDNGSASIKEVAGTGANKAGSLEELAAGNEVLLIYLPAGGEETVYEKLISNAGAGSIIIDLSAVSPETSKKNASKAAGRGVGYLEAPFSGDTGDILAGKVPAIFVGGDQAVLNDVQELLECFGSVFYMGPHGCGNITKLADNILSLTHTAIAAEGMVLGVKSGMETVKLYNILKANACRSYHFIAEVPKLIAGDLEADYTVDDGLANLAITLELAKEMKLPLPLVDTVNQVYRATSAMGYGQKGCRSVSKLFEKWSGVQLKTE